MWKTFKDLVSWDEYNSPSKLFVYFLETYGDSDIKYEDSINTCKLIRSTLAAIGALFMVTISIGAVASVIWAYVMYIAVLLTVGFDTSLYAEELAVIFYTVNGLLLAIFVGIGFSKLKDYRQQKQYEERQRIREQIRNGTYVEPVKSNSILREWLEALNDKICVEIDLTKYRTKSLKDAEESDY